MHSGSAGRHSKAGHGPSRHAAPLAEHEEPLLRSLVRAAVLHRAQRAQQQVTHAAQHPSSYYYGGEALAALLPPGARCALRHVKLTLIIPDAQQCQGKEAPQGAQHERSLLERRPAPDQHHLRKGRREGRVRVRVRVRVTGLGSGSECGIGCG